MTAWKKLEEAFGDGMHCLERESLYGIVEAGIQAVRQELAKE